MTAGSELCTKSPGCPSLPGRGACPPRSSDAMLRAPSLLADIRPPSFPGNPGSRPESGRGGDGALPPTPTAPPPGPAAQPSSRAPRRTSVSGACPRSPLRRPGGRGRRRGSKLASALPLSARLPRGCLLGSGEAASRRARRLTEDAAGGGRRGFRLRPSRPESCPSGFHCKAATEPPPATARWQSRLRTRASPAELPVKPQRAARGASTPALVATALDSRRPDFSWDAEFLLLGVRPAGGWWQQCHKPN